MMMKNHFRVHGKLSSNAVMMHVLTENSLGFFETTYPNEVRIYSKLMNIKVLFAY